METFAGYLLKSVVWLTGFAVVYFLFLQNERFFLLKRYYLISGILVSFIFPLLSVHYQVEVPAPITGSVASFPTDYDNIAVNQQINTDKPFDYRLILMSLYLSGVLFFAFRLIRSTMSLIKSIKKTNINNRGPAKLVRASDFSSSFSFFNYVFINPALSETEVEEIMNHELVHVDQKHWFDLLLVELLRLIQWVNPFAWIYTGFIRLNHEYIADEMALQRTSNPAIYRATLVNQMFGSPIISLSNSLNYSLNKKRFEMMKTIITSPYRRLKVLLVIPVFAIVFYAFATPEYQYAPTSEIIINTNQDSTFQERIKIRSSDGSLVKALIVVDGVVSENGIEKIDPTLILSMSVLKDKQATDKYGEKGENGVIEITTKKKTSATPADKPAEIAVTGYADQQQQARPLVVVDDVISDKNVSEVLAGLKNDIAKITRLAGKEATEKYGEKGKNGVIEIMTQKRAAELGIKIPASRQSPEDYPTFMGGKFDTFTDWVIGQIKYPPEAVEKGIQGRVSVSYTVEGNGTLSNVQYSGTPDPILGTAVLGTVITSPSWEPAKNPEFAKPFNFTVQVRFELPDKILNDPVYVVVEKMPMYPGGDGALLKFISDNMRYPETAKTDSIQGRVIIRFIVNNTGKVEDATVLKSVHPLLDAEAVRVISSLPDFTPGFQGDKPVGVYFMCPVSFALK